MVKKVGGKKMSGSGSQTESGQESGTGEETVQRSRMERASAIATKVKGKSGKAATFVKSNRNLIVYLFLFLYNASVLIYAFVKYNDFPSYEDYEKKECAGKQEVDHAILKVAGFTLMSAMALGGHMLINHGSIDFKTEDSEEHSGFAKMFKTLSHISMGVTTSGLILTIFRYYVNHTFAIVVGVLIGSLLFYDLIKLKVFL